MKSSLLLFLPILFLLGCGAPAKEETLQETADVGETADVKVFVIPKIDLPGLYTICMKSNKGSDCRDSDANGDFESLSFVFKGGDAVSVTAEHKASDNTCRNSLAIQSTMSQKSIAVSVNFPRAEDCWIAWEYR